MSNSSSSTEDSSTPSKTKLLTSSIQLIRLFLLKSRGDLLLISMLLSMLPELPLKRDPGGQWTQLREVIASSDWLTSFKRTLNSWLLSKPLITASLLILLRLPIYIFLIAATVTMVAGLTKSEGTHPLLKEISTSILSENQLELLVRLFLGTFLYLCKLGSWDQLWLQDALLL